MQLTTFLVKVSALVGLLLVANVLLLVNSGVAKRYVDENRLRAAYDDLEEAQGDGSYIDADEFKRQMMREINKSRLRTLANLKRGAPLRFGRGQPLRFG